MPPLATMTEARFIQAAPVRELRLVADFVAQRNNERNNEGPLRGLALACHLARALLVEGGDAAQHRRCALLPIVDRAIEGGSRAIW